MARRKQLRVLVMVTAGWLLWAVWFFLTGSETFALAVVDEEGSPVQGVSVMVDGRDVATTDSGGRAEVVWARSQREFTLTAPGYSDSTLVLEERPGDVVRARVESKFLRGRVTDAEQRPVPDVRIAAGYGEAATGADGRFHVRLAEPGPVRVWRPAWRPGDFRWDGSPGEQTVTIEPMVVKAVHVTGEAAGDPGRWSDMLRLVEDSELNAVMLDLKDEEGLVYYDTLVDAAHRAGAVAGWYDLAGIARELSDRDVYLIGRIVAFQDPIAARSIPEIAIGTVDGGVFSKGNQYFLDPTDVQAREYALQLAEEACRLGVDEIQFDYVRYPDGFGDSAVFDGGSDAETRVRTIRSFLEEAKVVLNDLGCVLAADIFGFITTASDDGGIGQHWEVVTDVLDVVSPMLYPSHYGPGWYGFERPVDHPREMVTQALRDGVSRLGSATVIRPWLQDFGYTPDQVRAQIDAAERFGFGWMLWNARSIVSEEALAPAGGEVTGDG